MSKLVDVSGQVGYLVIMTLTEATKITVADNKKIQAAIRRLARKALAASGRDARAAYIGLRDRAYGAMILVNMESVDWHTLEAVAKMAHALILEHDRDWSERIEARKVMAPKLATGYEAELRIARARMENYRAAKLA